MTATPDDAQVQAVAAVLRRLFGRDLRAVWLHGSATQGGLRPHSDIDLLAVLARPMTPAQRQGLLAELLRISAPYPAPPGGPRCLELMVFVTADLAAPDPPAEFLYGEWLRQGFEAGEVPQPVHDPENTLVLAQARQQGIALIGPAPDRLLPPIPASRINQAMRDALPALMAGLPDDARNVLLTLARMWHTVSTGAFAPKDAAAAWALPRMPAKAAAVLACARDAYLGRAGDEWEGDRDSIKETADYLRRQVQKTDA